MLLDNVFATRGALFDCQMSAPALVRSTKTFAHNLGAVDNRDKGTRIDLARIATQLHGLVPA